MLVFLYSIIIFLALVIGTVPVMAVCWMLEAAWARKYEREQFLKLKQGGR